MRRSPLKRRWKPNKFRARKTWREDMLFDSKLEADAFSELRLMEKANLIRELDTQREFELVVNEQLICRIVPDFFYVDVETGKEVVAEAKGVATPDWVIKWKLLQALHPEYDYRVYKRGVWE